MEAGAQSKSAYVRLADRAAAIYVPVVHSLALATFVGGWALGLGPREALLRAAAVLIITCPCALGLAVPAVQIAASGRLFRKRRAGQVRRGAGAAGRGRPRGVRQDRRPDRGPPALWPHGRSGPGRRRRAAGPRLAPSAGPGPGAQAGPGPVADEVEKSRAWASRALIDGRRARLGRAGLPRRGRRRRAPRPSSGSRFDGEAPRAACLRRRPARRRRRDGRGAEGPRPDGRGAVRRRRRGGGARPRTARGSSSWRAGLTPIEKAEAIDALKAAGRKAADGRRRAERRRRPRPRPRLDGARRGGRRQPERRRPGVRGRGADGAWSTRSTSPARPAPGAGELRLLGRSTIWSPRRRRCSAWSIRSLAALAMSGSSLVVTLNALRMNWRARR